MAISAELQIVINAVNNAKAQITSLVTDLNKVSTSLRNVKSTDVGGNQAAQLNNIATSAKSATDNLASFAVKAGAIALTIRELIRIPEAYKLIDARLRIAADSQNDYNNSQKETTRIALASRSSLEGVAGLYTKLKVNARLASDDAARLTEIIGKATQLDGGGAGAEAAIFQLQQGLSSGTLRGDELNSVLEQTPSLAKALADGLNLSVGGLRNIAAQGKLTTEAVKEALFKMQGDVEAKFKQLPVTTSQAFQNIKTQATLALGNIDAQLGLTAGIAKAMILIADNIQSVIIVAAPLAAIFVGLKTQALILSSGLLTAAGATSALAAAQAVLLAPITLVVAAISGLLFFITKGINDNNALTETVAEQVTVWEVLSAVMSIAADVISDVVGFIGYLIEDMPDATNAVADFGDQNQKTWTTSGSFARNFFNGILGFLPALGKALAAVAVAIEQSVSVVFSNISDKASLLKQDLDNVLKGDFSFSNYRTKAVSVGSEFKRIGKELASNLGEGLEEYATSDPVGTIFKDVNKKINEQRKNRPKINARDGVILNDPKKGTGNGTEGFGADTDSLKLIKENLSEIIKSIKETLSQANKAYEEAYKDNLIGIEDFYNARQTIVDKQSDDELAAQNALLTATKAAREKIENTSVTDKGAEKKRAKLADLDTEILKINQNLLSIENERAKSSVDIAINRERDLKALRIQIADIKLANDLVAGVATSEQRADAIRIRNAELLKKAQENEASAPGGTAAVKRKIDIEINQEVLSETEAKFNAVVARLRASQESVDIQRKNGILTETQAREQLVILNQQAATELDALLPKLKEAADALGPDAQAKVQAWRNEIAQTRLVVDETAVRINGSFRDSASTLFKDLATGAKTAKEAVLDFASTFVSAIAEIASQKLAENIFGGVTGGSGGIGGFISGLFGGTSGGKSRGETPLEPLYTKDASLASDVLPEIADPTKTVVDSFFSTVSDGFDSLVNVGKSVFDTIGGFLSSLVSGSGGSGSGGGFGGLVQAGLSLFGFAEGGLISGAGTGTSDSIPIAASNGEFVTRASQTARWLPLLHAINSGSLDNFSSMRIPTRPRFAEGGLIDKAAQAGNAPKGQSGSGGQNTRIVNVIDPAMAGEYLQSSAGEKVLLNFIGRNKSGIRSALS